jgi:Fic family protein
VSRVADIAELVGQVTLFDGLDPNPTLRRENQIRTIHSSLLIENNAQLTLEVIFDALSDALKQQRSADKSKSARATSTDKRWTSVGQAMDER